MHPSGILGVLLDWARFLYYQVLPIAWDQLVQWLYEWQALIAGALILIAGTIWVRSVNHASARTALTIAQAIRGISDAQGRDFPSLLLAKPAKDGVAGTAKSTPGGQGFDARLERLREIIRAALSAIPQTGDAVVGEGAELYRAVAEFSLEAEDTPTDKLRAQKVAEIKRTLASLNEASPEKRPCRAAWDDLVRLNRLAREVRNPATANVKA